MAIVPWVPISGSFGSLPALTGVTSGTAAPEDTITTPDGYDPADPDDIWDEFPEGQAATADSGYLPIVVVPPYSLAEPLAAVTLSGGTVEVLSYSLAPVATVVTGVTLSGGTITQTMALDLPAAVVAVAGVAPAIETPPPTEIEIPSAGVVVAAVRPVVFSGAEPLPLTFETGKTLTTYSDDDRTVTNTDEPNRTFLVGGARLAGKWYMEVQLAGADIGVPGCASIGIADSSINTSLGFYATSWGVSSGSGGSQSNFTGATTLNNSGVRLGTLTAGDVIGIAVDLDARRVWVHKNGTWTNSSDPAAGTGAIFSGWTNANMPLRPGMSLSRTGNSMTLPLPLEFQYTPAGFSPWESEVLKVVEVPVGRSQIAGVPPTTEPIPPLDLPTAGVTVSPVVPAVLAVSPDPIAATYSQRSVYVDNDAATAPVMTNGVSAETTQTGVDNYTDSAAAWVQMDFGSETSFSSVVVGCDFDETLAGGWGKNYTESADIIGSNNGTDWTTLAGTGTFSTGIKEISTPGASYRYVRIRRLGYLAVTEFYAKA